MKVTVIRGVTPETEGDWTEIEVAPNLKVAILVSADKSDPLNQLTAIHTRTGTFGTRVSFETPMGLADRFSRLADAFAATLAVYLDLAPEIRDAIAKAS